MKKISLIFLLSLSTIMLAACGTKGEVKDKAKELNEGDLSIEEPSTTSRLAAPTTGQNYEKPGSVVLISKHGPKEGLVGMLGGHSWSYTKGNETVLIEADSVSPHQLFDRKATDVNVTDMLNLQFDFEPISYDIIVWDEAGNNATYTDFASIQQRGKNVVEVLAHFEQGTVSYSFVLQLN